MILEQWLLTTTQPEQVGKLYTVGLNNIGQLGNNSVTFGNSFAQIGTLSWKSISVGALHTVAIRSDGLLYAWGSNLYGSIGANDPITNNNKSSPVQIGSSSWTLVDAKGFHTVALTADNRLFTWGLNSSGQLGDNTVNNTDRVLSYSVLSVYSNARFVLDYNNRLWAWARSNHDGAPGVGVPPATAITSPTQVPGSWSNVWAAPYTGFFVATNNSLWASGSNFGRFGNNTTTSTSVPTQISANNEWSFITGSFTGSILAIKPNGTLWAWGANTNVLGVDPIPSGSRSSPVQLGTASWTMVSVGASHAMGVQTDGSLWAWGTNTYGQLGNNANTNVLTPVKIGTSSWITVAAGQDYTLGITSSNTLFGWGRNINGHFAVGDGTSIDRSSPVVVGGAAANTSFTYVWASKAAAGANMAAIAANGAIWRWGNRDSFQNLAGGGDLSVPTIISGTNVTHIISGGGFSAFRSNTGTVSTYGLADGLSKEDLVSDSRGVFLLGQSSFRISPVQVGISSWSQVSAGSAHTLGIRSDGTLWAWGTASSGVLGLPGNAYTSISNRSSPVQVGTNLWKDVSAGLSHSVGITANNELYAWGNNTNYAVGQPYSYSMVGDAFSYLRSDGVIENTFDNATGQYGNSTTDNNTRFAHVPLNSSKSWRFLKASGQQRFAIDENYKLFAWGWNAWGQLGDGTTSSKSSPVQIGNDSWTTVAAGQDHFAAIRSDGALFTWGSGNIGAQGAIGNGGSGGTYSPVKIGSDSWSVVSAAGYTVMAIRSDGKLFGWGNNNNGKIGNNSNTNVSSPVQIGSDSWTTVAAGSGHSIAIKSDGTLWTWGLNSSGQLGTNDTISRSSPGQISTASWKHVFAGSYYGYQASFAIRDNGSLFAFGNATTTRLGDGTTVNKSSPVQLYSTSSFAMVGGDFERAVGLTVDGTLILWGDNASGQLLNGATGGAGTGVTRPIIQFPSKIANGTWNQVSAGSAHSVALDSNNYLYGWGHPAVAVPVKFASWTMAMGAGIGDAYYIRSDGKLFTGGSGRAVIGASPAVTVVQAGVDTWSHISTTLTSGEFYGIKSDGSMWRGGSGGAISQIGVGSSWSKVWSRQHIIIAIRSDGGLFTWHPTSTNQFGQLGHNTQNTTVTTPVQVGTSSWVFATSSYGFTVTAVTVDGNLWSWGRNTWGGVGDGTIIHRSSPVQIPGTWANTGQTIAGLGALDTTAAIRSNGTLWTWGGAVSYIQDFSRSSPVQYGTDSWRFLSGNIEEGVLFGIRSDYRLFGAGRGAEGQLGTNSIPAGAPLTEVTGGGSWIFVNTEAPRHTYAIKTDGSLHFTGFAFFTQINEATYFSGTGKSSFVQVGLGTEYLKSPTQLGSSQWKKISAGSNYTLGVQSNNILYVWGANYAAAVGFPLVRTTPTSLGYYGVNATAGLNHAALLVTSNTN